MTAMTFAIGGFSYWMPAYLVDSGHAGDLAHVNLVFGALLVVAGITATLIGGILGDYFRRYTGGSYFIVSAAGMLLGFPMFLAVLFVPFPLAWVFLFLAVFCLFFNTGPSNTALANVTHPSVRASAFALNILFIHALGDAISPPIIGAISDATKGNTWFSAGGDVSQGNMNIAFLVVGAMMVMGAVFWWIGSRYLDRDTARAELPPAA
jgi:MFS family permease